MRNCPELWPALACILFNFNCSITFEALTLLREFLGEVFFGVEVGFATFPGLPNKSGRDNF